VIPAIEDTEDPKEEDESYTDSTNEGMSTPAPAGREQEFVPVGAPEHSAKTPLDSTPMQQNSTIGRTHIRAGGERSIKKSNFEPRQNRTGILTSDSSSPKLRVKGRSSDHVNENGSPVSKVVKRRHKHRYYH